MTGQTKHTDRELLELAAKAAGYSFSWNEQFGCAEIWRATDKNKTFWQPHLDDGDALRLRNWLGAQVIDEGTCVFVGVYRFGIPSIEVREAYERDEPGGFASDLSVNRATRRAIVRAAAELGSAA